MKKWDVVIIGSGISSLTAATLLSSRGKSVCVLEQYTKPGGYLHSFNRFGFRFETGSHYVGALGPGQPFRVLLEYLGVYDDEVFVPLDPGGFDVFQFPSSRFELPTGYEATTDRLSERFPSDREGIHEFFHLVRDSVAQFPTYSFNESPDDSAVLRALETPLAAVVERLVKSPQLVSILYASCAMHGVKPSDIPFGLHSLILDSILRGPYGFRNGGDGLAKRFVRRIEENGGAVRTSARVNRLVTVNRDITEIHLASGECLLADWVISGAHPKATFRLIDDSILSPAFRSRLTRLRESASIFGVYAISDSSERFHPRKNYYYFGSDDPADIFADARLEGKPSLVYVARPDRDSQGESNRVPVALHAPGPFDWFAAWKESATGKRPPEYRELKRRVSEGLLQFVDEYEPGFRSSIRQFDSSSALTNLHYNGSEDGSAYGVYMSVENSGIRALGPRTHVRNLLLTGQSCLCPGLLGAAVSGLRTAGALVGLRPIIKELRATGGMG